jgi:hypothetical protein
MAGAPWHLVAEGNWMLGSCSSLRESPNRPRSPAPLDSSVSGQRPAGEVLTDGAAGNLLQDMDYPSPALHPRRDLSSKRSGRPVVERRGFEPLTSAVRGQRSPS